MEKPHTKMPNGGLSSFSHESGVGMLVAQGCACERGSKALPMPCSGTYSSVIAYVLDFHWLGLGDELMIIAECSLH